MTQYRGHLKAMESHSVYMAKISIETLRLFELVRTGHETSEYML